MKKYVWLLTVALMGLVGCEGPTDTQSQIETTSLSVDETSQKILNEGMTCDVQSKLRAFSEAEMSLIAQNVRDSSDDSEMKFEENCSGQSVEQSVQSDDVAIVQQAYSNPSAGEAIEKTTNSGGVNGWIDRDSASYGWLCNAGQSEFPADFIINVGYLADVYNNRSKLRVRSNNIFATCALAAFGNQLSGRVYSDNGIRVCVGYTRMILCGAGYLYSSDFSLLLVP